MKKLLILLIFSTILFGCEDEKIVIKEVEKKYSWTAHEDFQYDEVTLMNSFVTNTKLFTLGMTSFSSLVADSLNHPDLPFGGSVCHYSNWYDQPSNKKLPISTNFFISYSESTSWIGFIPTLNPVSGNSMASITLSEIDTSFMRFQLVSYYSGECMAINNNNQALIPYLSTDNDYSLKLLLVNIRVKSDGIIRLDTISTKVIKIPDSSEYNVISIQSLNDIFYVTTSSKTYRVNTAGELQNVTNNRLYSIVESNKVLYGFGGESIFSSIDSGLTWTKGYSIPAEYIMFKYSKVNNKIIAYRNSQLFEITLTQDSIIARELDNDGLVGKTITSVSGFGNKVYATSLSGLYFKTIEDFFNDKKTEK